MKIAVVTGCAGFIGAELTQTLLDEGWYVYGIDKLTYAADKDFIQVTEEYYKTFKFIQADIAELSRLPDCDVIFNLAAESDVDSSNKNSRHFVLSNVLGVQNLLNLITSNNIIKGSPPVFVQVSTDEVYGDIEEGYFDETARLRPSNPYSATKASADLLITSWARTHGLDYRIVRPTNTFGPGQYPEKLIPITIKSIVRNKKIKLHNKGTPKRTWTSVYDTVDGIITAYEKGKPSNVYNISSMEEVSNLEVVSKLVKIMTGSDNIGAYVDMSYNRPGQDIRYGISNKKIKKLGWQTTIDFDSMLHVIVNTDKDNIRW